VFKKAAQIAVTLGLLIGAYSGYTHAFRLVATQLASGSGEDESAPFPEISSKTSQRATELARESFGEAHWASNKDLRLQFYEANRGAWLFAQDYKPSNDGKRITVRPFAMISVSRDGKSRKTATSQEAVIDLSQPFVRLKGGGGPSHVVHARMTGDVQIRDDKGTRDPEDDLRVAMDYVEYDEKTLQITTDSDVTLQDRDLLMTGMGLMIQLRHKLTAPSGSSPAGGGGGGGGIGFEAETAFLYKNVHLIVNNVTSNGILPGSSKPDAKGKTPLDLTSDGEMRIDFPRPHPVVVIGPPDLEREPEPTLAKFQRNVKVVRGLFTPDQLNCDTLDLTLMPDRKAVVAATVAGPADSLAAGATAPASSGPLTELKLRKALAQGHAVWIQSESQGLRARCVELKYEKHLEEGQPDKTYLNGGSTRRLWVEKVEYVNAGTRTGPVKSVMNLNAFDATIFDYGPGGTSRVVSRGPGKSEERPARNASVVRTAWWEDEMELRTWRETPGLAPGATPAEALAASATSPLRRLLTLTGPSKLVDHKDGNTLDAKTKIVAEFQSAPKAQAQAAAGDGPPQIKWLQAFDDVHLTATGKTLTARKQFDASFVQPEVAIVFAQPGPMIAPAPPDAKPDAPPAAIEPAVDGRANYVYATVLQGDGTTKGEIRDAKLRGGVMVHQDPAPGETYGKDASGEALDLFGQGKGLMKFAVSAEEPQAIGAAKTKLALQDDARAAGGKAKLASKARTTPPTTLARVEFDGKVMEGHLLGLDQKGNYAWAQGEGTLIQLAERGLLDDKGLAPPAKSVGTKANGPNTKDQLVITWNDEMKFHGLSQDLQGRPAAKAEFRGTAKEVRTPTGPSVFRRGVEAKMADAAIYCDTMDVYMDRPIAFNRLGKKPAPAADENRSEPTPPAEPDAQIAQLDCRGKDILDGGRLKFAGVDITSQKHFPDSPYLKEKQRIQHVHVTYDKRSGDFEAPGPGTVFLYQAEAPKDAASNNPVAVVRPVTAVGRNGQGSLRPESRAVALKQQPPFKLTEVHFTDGMRGRFGVAKDQADTETRNAEFVGYVQAFNAMVTGPFKNIDFDHPPDDNLFITSDILRVRTTPPPPGTKAAARQLLFADGNAQARTVDRTIQGDRITYDSGNDLTYVYGDNGKEIVMIEQKSIGQEPNVIRGFAGMYNKRTRQFVVKDPQAIQMFDNKSGVRPKAFFPDLGGSPKPIDPIKLPRVPLQKPSRNSTERNSFTGH